MQNVRLAAILVALLISYTGALFAQDEEGSDAAQANNPLASSPRSTSRTTTFPT